MDKKAEDRLKAMNTTRNKALQAEIKAELEAMGYVGFEVEGKWDAVKKITSW